MSKTDSQRHQHIAVMVAELDARRHGRGHVEDHQFPDDEDHEHESVEFIGRDAGGEIAVEHSRIESYPEQAKGKVAVVEIFPSGGPDLRELGDIGAHFALGVDPGAMRLVPYVARPAVRLIITEWIRANLERVPWPHVPGCPISIAGADPGVPFTWRLWRAVPPEVSLLGPLASVVRVTFARPDDIEAQREARLDTALARKLGKLHAAAQGRPRSVLVLEERDLAMSAPSLVSKGLQAVAHRHALPDVIYLFDTSVGNPIAYVLWEDGSWREDFPMHTFQRSDALS